MLFLKSIEIAFKNSVTPLVALFFRRGRCGKTSEATIDAKNIRSILLLRHDKLGDVVVSLPTIAALRTHYPSARLVILASPRNHQLLIDDTRIDRVELYTKRILEVISLVIRLRREKFDLVIDLIRGDSVTALILSQIIGGRSFRIGLHKEGHAKFYDFVSQAVDDRSPHIIDATAGCLRALGVADDVYPTVAPVMISPARRRKIDLFVAGIRQTGGARLIGVNISAGMPSRRWAGANYSAVLRGLFEKFPTHKQILLCSPSDRGWAEEIIRDAGDGAVLVPDGLHILDIAALIAHLDILITPDTSVVHIARGHNVSVVGLYSNAEWNYRFWHPYGQMTGQARAKSVDDIFDITPTEVMACVERAMLLQAIATQSAAATARGIDAIADVEVDGHE